MREHPPAVMPNRISRLSLCATALFFGTQTIIWADGTPGGVDPTFDVGRGAEFVLPSRGISVLIQPDGKVLVTGDFNALNLYFVPPVLRFNTDGTLDASFDASTLSAPVSFDNEYAPKLLALQANGQMLLGGTFTNPDGSARYLTRLNSDGGIDTTFNPRIENGSLPSAILQARILSGGRVLIGGRFTSINGISRSNLARLHADGSLDQTFSAAVLSKSFVVQSSGKPIVSTGGYFTYGGDRLVRLNTDGSLDGTFAAVTPPPDYIAGGLLVQSDDKVLWTAIAIFSYDWPYTIISRLAADGANDPDFHPYSSYGGGPLFLQQDGRIIISSVYAGANRLNTDGSPDPSFHPIALGSFAQQADGRLIIAGSISTQPYGIRRLFLDGSSDGSFAPGMGLVSIRKVSIDQALLLPNGKVLITGNFNYIDRNPRRKVAVLNGNGTLDGNFDAEDFLRAYWPGSSDYLGLTVQSDGKILVDFGSDLVRLNSDGRVDNSFHYSPLGYVGPVALQPGGKILLSRSDGLRRLNPDGSVDPAFHPEQPGGLVGVQPDAKILIRGPNDLFRLNAEGSRDTGFNADEVRGYLAPSLCTLQPDGKLLVSRFVGSIEPPAFVRLHRNGSIDPTFRPAFPSARLAVADLTGIYSGAGTGQPVRPEVGRLFSDGSRDPNFAAGFNPGGRINSLLIQPDGQLLVAGSFDSVNGVARAGIVRLNGAVSKKLANISTRVRVSTGQMVEIGGFIMTGNLPKKVIVRALGPSLGSSGVIGSDLLANPSLELHDSTGAVIRQNDDWRDSQEAEILASGFPPQDGVEAAIVEVLAPGQYTAVVRGLNGGEGIALAEVYDLDPASDSSLANISTRGFVNDNDGVMIGGFILRGPQPSTIAVRAIGPSLGSSGIAGALSDPMLELHDADGTIIATNDNWRENEEEIRAAGLAPANDLESALVRTLVPGAYTAILRGEGSTTGIGLVEVYHLQ